MGIIRMGIKGFLVLILSVLVACIAASELRAQAMPDSIASASNPASIQAGETPAEPRFDLGLEEIVVSLEKALPPNWHIASLQRKQIPRKWHGPAEAVLVRLEDESMVLHHTNGFEYHPFYKLWLCPRAWQGTMQNVVMQGDEAPSILLGINHIMKVFYLTLGANTWPNAPDVLRRTLDLTSLTITTTPKQTIDSAMKAKLFKQLENTESGSSTLLLKVVGLENSHGLAYVEYTDSSFVTLTEEESQFLSEQIFTSLPEVKTVYVRRICGQFLSDRIFDRADSTANPDEVLFKSIH